MEVVKKRVLVQVKSSFKGEKRKRYVKRGSRDWVKVTPGYLLVFFGIILISGAMKVRKTNMLWGTKWQTGLPMVQNACTRDSFNQIRQYIHFVDNMKLLPKDHPRWDPLQKIQPILDLLLKQLALAYVLGDRLSIDEAMIKYCGKFVSFVQYMPKKPIKYGIKVFALCCAYTGYLYAYEVYTGRESAKDGSPKMVITRLLMMAGVATVVGNVRTLTGRILYTDNWYTGLDVIEYVYRLFGIMMVGTVSLTTKLSRTASDFPFHKFTNSITSKVPRGWMRCAYQQVYVGGRLLYTLQATLWKDKKMVGFLHC